MRSARQLRAIVVLDFDDRCCIELLRSAASLRSVGQVKVSAIAQNDYARTTVTTHRVVSGSARRARTTTTTTGIRSSTARSQDSGSRETALACTTTTGSTSATGSTSVETTTTTTGVVGI